MKIINKLGYVLLFFGMLTGCSGLLDDVRPDTYILNSKITVEQLPLLVRGMYKRMLGGLYGQGNFGDEIASDNFGSLYSLSAVSNYTNFDACNVSVDDGLICGRMYDYPYNGIGAADIIINFVNDNGDEDPVSRQAKGEALVLRGYCYMLLAERFGDAVITLSAKDDILREQDSEDKVWERAEIDLKEALSYLKDYEVPTSISLQAAQALLARLYLNRGVLTSDAGMVANAGMYASQVLSSSTSLELNPDFQDNFRSGSTGSEVIFCMQEVQSVAYNAYLYSLLSPESYEGRNSGNTWVEPSLATLYNEPDDQRAQLILKDVYSTTGQELDYCVKFPADNNPVWSIVRLAEMHLIVAEVAARSGVIDVSGYNAVRSVRNASLKQNTDFANVDAFLKEIENERRREFAGEGLRWMDMRRFGSMKAHLESKGVDIRRVHFPVYSGERVNNPKLHQTPYYQ